MLGMITIAIGLGGSLLAILGAGEGFADVRLGLGVAGLLALWPLRTVLSAGEPLSRIKGVRPPSSVADPEVQAFHGGLLDASAGQSG